MSTHVVEELGKLGEGLFNALDILVTLLHFLVGRIGLTVPVRLEELFASRRDVGSRQSGHRMMMRE